MATGKRPIEAQSKLEEGEDVLSYCGSFSGETFSSRRSRTDCARQRSIDMVAQKLREDSQQQSKKISMTIEFSPATRRRFNQSFHHLRLLIAMMGGLSFGLMSLLRYNISVAILNMVNQTALYMHEHPDSSVEEFLAEGYSTGGDFDWDNEIQNMIMSWYMIAYTLPQVASTRLGLIVGARLMTAVSLSICALATLLTPVSAYWGWQWVIALRLMNGIGASAVLPMMLNLIEHWMPFDEITLGLTVSNALRSLITSLAPLISGYLCSIHWSHAFYVPGAATLLFCLVWVLLITDKPEQSWLISQKELDLICAGQSCSTTTAKGANKQSDCKSNVDTGNKSTTQAASKSLGIVDVLKVPSFYAYLACFCLHCSSFNGFTFILPAYLRQFLKIGISENGLFCSIIQCGGILAVMWPHPLLCFLQSRLKLSLTASRRITQVICCLVMATTWIYVGALHEFQLVLLFIGRCFAGCNDVIVTGSLMSNYVAAGLSSTAFSMVNTVGNFSVVFVSTLIGWFLDYTGQSEAGWFGILGLMGANQLIVMIIFCTLIRSDPINFNKHDKNEEKKIAELAAVTCDQSTANNKNEIVVDNKK